MASEVRFELTSSEEGKEIGKCLAEHYTKEFSEEKAKMTHLIAISESRSPRKHIFFSEKWNRTKHDTKDTEMAYKIIGQKPERSYQRENKLRRGKREGEVKTALSVDVIISFLGDKLSASHLRTMLETYFNELRSSKKRTKVKLWVIKPRGIIQAIAEGSIDSVESKSKKVAAMSKKRKVWKLTSPALTKALSKAAKGDCKKTRCIVCLFTDGRYEGRKPKEYGSAEEETKKLREKGVTLVGVCPGCDDQEAVKSLVNKLFASEKVSKGELNEVAIKAAEATVGGTHAFVYVLLVVCFVLFALIVALLAYCNWKAGKTGDKKDSKGSKDSLRPSKSKSCPNVKTSTKSLQSSKVSTRSHQSSKASKRQRSARSSSKGKRRKQ